MQLWSVEVAVSGPPSPKSVTQSDISSGLRALGVSAGLGVIVHSSLSSFGRVERGAAAVIGALMDVLTPEGTLLMPSFNHGLAYALTGDGCFDPTQSPTCNGRIPDTFWRMADVHRSWQPTHAFAAWGRHARRYTEHHHRTLTTGPDSPLGLLHADDGYGLLIGVDYRANTFHHAVEQSRCAPCLGRRSVALPMRLPDGRRVMGRTWGWRDAPCPINDSALYAPEMAARGLERTITIGQSTLRLFRLRDCYEVIAELLRHGYAGHPPCKQCSIRPVDDANAAPSDWDPSTGGLLPDSESLRF